jgi:Ni/Fe-hydrogenase subunit HybB-like protein
MVIVESHLSSRALNRHLEMDILADIGHVLAGIMVIYAGLRFYDLWSREQLAALFAFDYESLLALLELGPFLLLPLALLSSPTVRMNAGWMYGSALLVVMGFVVNRLNVSITGLESAQGMHYVPSLAEAGVTLFLIALGFGLFRLAVTHLPVFPEEEDEEEIIDFLPPTLPPKTGAPQRRSNVKEAGLIS